MSFLDAEISRSIQFRRVGGQTFNTEVTATQSGQENRNRNWLNPRAEYTAMSMVSPGNRATDLLKFVEDMRTFFMLVGGRADGFRYFDPLDYKATNEPMVLVSGAVWQLQKTYSRFSRTYVRPITKPITASVSDYQGNALTNTLTMVSGGTISSVDHATGQVTLTGVSGTPHASFFYHVPCRFTSDKFEPEVLESNLNPIDPLTGLPDPTQDTRPIIEWHSLGLIEVRPPNY